MVGSFRYSFFDFVPFSLSGFELDHSEGVPLTFAAYQDAFITVASTVTPSGTQFYWETRDKLSNGAPGYLTEANSSTRIDPTTKAAFFSVYLSDHRAYFEGGSLGDWFEGGSAGDTFLGREGADWLFGNAGDDLLDGGNGADRLNGGDGNDTLVGGNDAAADGFWGEAGSDSIYGGNGDDRMDGGEGADFLSGGDGNDFMNGGNNADILSGGNGNDQIFGTSGSDTLRGDAGDDRLDGGQDGSADYLDGGAGSDTYIFTAGMGADVIAQFDDGPAGDQDIIQIAASIVSNFATLQTAMTQNGSDVNVYLGGYGGFVIQNVTLAQLGADDFTFV